MPIPAAAALVPLAAKGVAKVGMLGKLKSALAALTAGKAGVAHKTYSTLKPIIGREGARKAGEAMHRIGRGTTSLKGFKKNLGMPMTRNDIAMAVAPDLIFGGLTAATTEGDIVDKAIAGAGSAAGGIVGGVGARGILGPKSGLGVLSTEMVGGMLGDQIGYGAAENLIRMKNGGQTPLEQKMAEGDEAYRQQIMEQLRQQYGLI